MRERKRAAGKARPAKPHWTKPRTEADIRQEREGPTWLYGHHAVTAALANAARKRHRLVATRNAARGLEAYAPEILEPKAIDKLLPPDAVHQGLALLAAPLAQPSLSELLSSAKTLVFLDQVTDPHNAGAIVRSAAAFGAGGVVTTLRNAPAITGVLAKAASGALEHVPYVQVTNLADALSAAGETGYARLGLDEAGVPLEEALAATDQPIALVLGAEGSGLRERTRATCDKLVRLATSGPIGALNVSNAAAVALYAVQRRR